MEDVTGTVKKLVDVELNEDDRRQLTDALTQLKLVGERYPAHLAARAGR